MKSCAGEGEVSHGAKAFVYDVKPSLGKQKHAWLFRSGCAGRTDKRTGRWIAGCINARENGRQETSVDKERARSERKSMKDIAG